ncbi:proprotein convertase P-domain-containing protein, partial [Lysobacter sp. CFH 32150]|nr:proprotein convertase P-domain-containing protein [Lysobacter sp. CFH 32150]
MHPYVGDLKLDLIAPDGTVYNLRSNTGGSADNIVETYTK